MKEIINVFKKNTDYGIFCLIYEHLEEYLRSDELMDILDSLKNSEIFQSFQNRHRNVILHLRH